MKKCAAIHRSESVVVPLSLLSSVDAYVYGHLFAALESQQRLPAPSLPLKKKNSLLTIFFFVFSFFYFFAKTP